MGNAVSEADSYTEEYSAYESSRLRGDDNDTHGTWDYSLDDSRGRMAPSESSTSQSDQRDRHRQSRSPVKSRSRSPPRKESSWRSFSDDEHPTSATFTTDMAHRDHKLKQQRSPSNSPRRANSPRSPYASPRSSSSPRSHRERRQPQYDSDDSSEMEERDRRRLYKYGQSYDDYDVMIGDGEDDRVEVEYDSIDESDDDRYRKRRSPRRDRSKSPRMSYEKEEGRGGDDVDFVSITDVSVELNPNRKIQGIEHHESLEAAQREVELIQLYEDEERFSHHSRTMSPLAAAQTSPHFPHSPIHLEHLPSPPNSPHPQQTSRSNSRATSPMPASPQRQSPVARAVSPHLFFRKDELPPTLQVNPDMVAAYPTQNQVYTAVPLHQAQPLPAKLLNRDETVSPIPSVTAETYYGGSFHAMIDQSELYPEISPSYAEMSRQMYSAGSPAHDPRNDDDDNDSRDPRGAQTCDGSVEHSLMTSPEEIMARHIIQARLRQALAKGLSYNESTEESASVPSVSIKSLGTFDNNGESTGSFDDRDIEFVKQYETVFDQFVNANLNLMARHPELIYNLRVAKLQKLFQVAADTEAEMEEQVQAVEKEKRQLLINHKKELIEAARRKAALEIQLRQELNSIEQATLEVTGKMTWQLIIANLTRASRHHQLIQNLSRNRVSRSTILEILPATDETRNIRTAIAAPASNRLTDKQQSEMRQLQVDNTFLKAEVNVLEKKLAALQTNSKKYAWVDSIFVRMDPKHIKKLKHRFQKNLGVSF